MFDEIGRKIKVLAKVVFVAGVVVSLIITFVLAKQVDEVPYSYEDTYKMFAFISITIGPLVSYISSMFTYGFGELIEKTSETAKNTRAKSTSQVADVENKKHSWKCDSCGQTVYTTPCPNCGYDPNADKKNTLAELLENKLITQDEYDERTKQ